MANNTLENENKLQLLWNPYDIQKFVGPEYVYDLQEFISDLIPQESSSLWLMTTLGQRSPDVTNEKKESLSRANQDAAESTTSCKSSDETVWLTTVGLLLLSTLTCQTGSQTLIESVKALVKQSYVKPGFQQHLNNVPTLMGLGLDGLLSFCNFCIGHSLLCTTDGGVVGDVGILKVWANIVQPLSLLLDNLIIDHLQISETWQLGFPVPANEAILKTFSKQQKTAIYTSFDSYDFEGDRRYQSGVQQIQKKLLEAEGGGHGTDLELEAKLYYYSRFIQKVDKDDYVAWLVHSKSSDISEKPSSNNQEDTHKETISASSSSLQREPKLGPSSTSDSPNTDEKANMSAFSSSPPKMEPILSSPSSTDSPTITAETVDVSASSSSPPEMEPKLSSLSSTDSPPTDDTADVLALRVPLRSLKTTTSPDNTGVETPSTEQIANAQFDSQSGTLDSSNDVTFNISEDVTFEPPQDASSEPVPYPKSFLEILRLVESGEDIPGVEVLDIKPTGTAPTESNMEPVRKPWMK